MKRLTLIRHAKSSWKHPELVDHDRPLNKRGRRDAPRMAERLRAAGFAPDVMLTSTAVRARVTCSAIVETCRLGDVVRSNRALYHADLEDVLEVVAAVDRLCDGALGHIAVVGHNPGLTELLEWLTHAGIDNVPTCAVASVEIDGDSYIPTTGAARLVDYATPKNDPALEAKA